MIVLLLSCNVKYMKGPVKFLAGNRHSVITGC